MRLAGNETVEVWLLAIFAGALKLIDVDSVFVNSGTDHEVCGFVLNKEVAKSLDLIKARTGAHSEHSFPSVLPGEAVVELIRKFNAVGVGVEFRIEV